MAGRPLASPRESVPGDGLNTTGPVGLMLVAAGMAGLVAGSKFLGTSPSPLTWYLARASGFTLYLLFWLSVVTGLGLTTKLLDALGGRGGVWQLHRFATELAFVFLGLHMLSLALDPSVSLGALGVLVPFISDVRQPWTDLGILAAMGFTGIAASFAIRRLLGQGGWRALHYAAFPLWLLALVHGVGAGSDSGRPWAIVLYLATTATVVFLSLYRLLRIGRRAQPPVPPERRRRAFAAADSED